MDGEKEGVIPIADVRRAMMYVPPSLTQPATHHSTYMSPALSAYLPETNLNSPTLSLSSTPTTKVSRRMPPSWLFVR